MGIIEIGLLSAIIVCLVIIASIVVSIVVEK